MSMLKAIKEFLFPKMYSGIEIAEMAKNFKFDYFPETLDLIYNSNKLTDNEKQILVNRLIIGYTKNKFIDKRGFEYLKSKLE